MGILCCTPQTVYCATRKILYLVVRKPCAAKTLCCEKIAPRKTLCRENLAFEHLVKDWVCSQIVAQRDAGLQFVLVALGCCCEFNDCGTAKCYYFDWVKLKDNSMTMQICSPDCKRYTTE